MGVIKQLKQFVTGMQIFPITKTNAVYDDEMGRLDNILRTPKDAGTLGGHPPSHFLTEVEKDANVEGSLANLISKGSGSNDEINALGNRVGSVEGKVNTLSTQVNGFDSRINAKADSNITFTEATATAKLTSGEAISTSFGKIAKVITDFIAHIAQNATANVFGHVKLSDNYASSVQNNKAANGLGASQYALYSAYNSLTTDSGVTMKAKGNKSTATLDFLDIGTFRIAGLTNTNSPSGTDTDGILINASAMNLTTTAMSATFQIFFGKASQTVYARLQMGDSWTNAWVKLSA